MISVAKTSKSYGSRPPLDRVAQKNRTSSQVPLKDTLLTAMYTPRSPASSIPAIHSSMLPVKSKTPVAPPQLGNEPEGASCVAGIAAELRKDRTRHIAEAHAKVVAAVVGSQIVGRRKAPHLVGLASGAPLASGCTDACPAAAHRLAAWKNDAGCGRSPLALGYSYASISYAWLVVGWTRRTMPPAGKWRLDWKVEGDFALRMVAAPSLVETRSL